MRIGKIPKEREPDGRQERRQNTTQEHLMRRRGYGRKHREEVKVER